MDAKKGSTLHESRLTNGVAVFANKLAGLLAKDDFLFKKEETNKKLSGIFRWPTDK